MEENSKDVDLNKKVN